MICFLQTLANSSYLFNSHDIQRFRHMSRASEQGGNLSKQHKQLFWSFWFSCCTVHVNNWTGLNYCFTIPNIKVIWYTIPAVFRSRFTYWILTKIEVCPSIIIWGPQNALRQVCQSWLSKLKQQQLGVEIPFVRWKMDPNFVWVESNNTNLGGGFKYFFFTAIWGRFPVWLIFFKWVETTN